METKTTDTETRAQVLYRILDHERTHALERVHEMRARQDEEAIAPPLDDLDQARSLADVETHASLIERDEERLKAIDFALSRLERGLYGICADCGDHIAVERLRAIPFAAYCVGCQELRAREARPSKEWIDRALIHQWNLPAEMEITSELPRDESTRGPEEMAMRITIENQPAAPGAEATKRRGRRH